MAQPDLLKRYLDVGMAVSQLTRSRAEAVVKELVRAGEVQRERAQEVVDDLLERSRKNTEAVTDLVRRELRAQVSRLGIATKDDLAKLEARLSRKAAGAKATTRPPAKKARKAPSAAARKAPAAGG